jgi:hypothetical protein
MCVCEKGPGQGQPSHISNPNAPINHHTHTRRHNQTYTRQTLVDTPTLLLTVTGAIHGPAPRRRVGLGPQHGKHAAAAAATAGAALLTPFPFEGHVLDVPGHEPVGQGLDKSGEPLGLGLGLGLAAGAAEGAALAAVDVTGEGFVGCV